MYLQQISIQNIGCLNTTGDSYRQQRAKKLEKRSVRCQTLE